MVPSAPRYDPRIDRLVSDLYEPSVSMAEICRRVADEAQELGFTRPSLVHLRTLVRDERDRREAERLRGEELRALAADVAADVVAGRIPNVHAVRDRMSEAGRH